MTKRLEVVYTETSFNDLDAVRRSLVTMGAHPVVADRYILRIMTPCDKIGDAPHSGRARQGLRPGLRMIGFERRAVILYRISADRVQIARVYHGGQDYEERGRLQGG